MSHYKRAAYTNSVLTPSRLTQIDCALSILEDAENDEDDPNEVLGFVIQDFMSAPDAIPQELFSRFCDALFSNEIDNDCRQQALELFQIVAPRLQSDVLIALDTYVHAYPFSDDDAIFIPFLCRVVSEIDRSKEAKLQSLFAKIRSQYGITFEDVESANVSKFPETYRKQFQHLLDFQKKVFAPHRVLQDDEPSDELPRDIKRKRMTDAPIFSLSEAQISQLRSKFTTQKAVLIFDLDETLVKGNVKNGSMLLRPGLNELWDWITHLKEILPTLKIGLWTHALEEWKQKACSKLGMNFDFSISRTDLEKMPSSFPGENIGLKPKNLHDPAVLKFTNEKFACEIKPNNDLIIFIDDRENGIADGSHHYLINRFEGNPSDTGLTQLLEDLQKIIQGLADHPSSLDEFTLKKDPTRAWWSSLVAPP